MVPEIKNSRLDTAENRVSDIGFQIREDRKTEKQKNKNSKTEYSLRFVRYGQKVQYVCNWNPRRKSKLEWFRSSTEYIMGNNFPKLIRHANGRVQNLGDLKEHNTEVCHSKPLISKTKRKSYLQTRKKDTLSLRNSNLKYTHFQVYIRHRPKQTTSWGIKQDSKNFN